MIVRIDKSFEKDVNKIKDKSFHLKIADCIEQIMTIEQISSIKNLKKLKGAENFYRIRIGEYRLGILIENDSITFIRCLHRKDIYKYFPR
ncbi:type II toxin-antitoxin system RelE family toxin [Parabacteroides sp. FAFU027]|uniref:type II toxin-antitoxin system RelE family toxin n=1 Tax=Parabacteroides sp. FAFU027 TaxID=2922715 RepID=UPI00397C72DF